MGKKRHRRSNAKAKKQSRSNKSKNGGGSTRSMIDLAIFVLVGVATLGLAFFGVFYGDHKIPSIWLMFGCVVLYALAASLFWQQRVAATGSAPDSLRATLDGGFFGNENGSPIVLKHEGTQGLVVSPISVSLAMTITYVGSNPISLVRFDVEVKDGWWGRWIPLSNIPDRGGTLYWVLYNNPKTSMVMQVKQLDAALDSPLQPNVPVHGFLFFEHPSVFARRWREGKANVQWRLTAEDTAGNVYQSPLVVDATRDHSGVRPNLPQITGTGIREDLSVFPWVPYHPK